MSPDAPRSVETRAAAERPIVLIGRGYSGTRVLALLAQACGLFIGSRLNVSRDSLEMAPAIYAGVRRKADADEPERTAAELRAAGLALWEGGGRPPLWGFKLPEAILLLPELRRAFPQARFAFIKRDPLMSAAGRVHPTADPAVPFGHAALVLAARHAGLAPEELLAESVAWRLAVTTAHQFALALAFRDAVPADDWCELSLERTVVRPADALARLAAFLGVGSPAGDGLGEIDPARALQPRHSLPPAEEARVAALVAPLRARLGYGA